MADVKQIQFGQRLVKINKRNQKLARGYVTSVNHDGLIIARPHRKSSHTPLRGLFLCLLVLMVFKGFLYAQLGETAYSDRMALLEGGTMVEQIGAYAMKPDPVTTWIASYIGNFI